MSGSWGYGSTKFLHEIRSPFHSADGSSHEADLVEVSRTDVLSLLAILYANMEVELPKPAFGTRPVAQQERCVGVVGKRMILMNSLVKNCETVDDIFGFVILDCDSGAIPRTLEGLVLAGIPQQFPTWEDTTDTPKIDSNVIPSGSEEDCTRHIEADWDGIPERMVLCIRYKGRRVGSLNPTHADIAFCTASVDFPGVSSPTVGFDPTFFCMLDDLVISGRLVTSGRFNRDTPVVVHAKGNPCLRYAAAAWYSSYGDVILVNNTGLQQGFEYWKTTLKGALNPGSQKSSISEFVALIG